VARLAVTEGLFYIFRRPYSPSPGRGKVARQRRMRLEKII